VSLTCPNCGFVFKALAFNAAELPDLAPVICESCAGLSILFEGAIRKPSTAETRAIMASPAWRNVLKPVRDLILSSFAPPADRSKTMLTDGSPVTTDHRTIQSSGMQKGYVVLTDEERARGWVRPYRDTYTHKVCGTDTTMGRKIAETYARDPGFYNGTFCCACRTHRPLSEFVWKGTEEEVGS
jgi:hypothetical protein